ncbi:MAG TPA: Fur family transcriptional regulator [Steroidobacteraceae bacterium]|nr:Fur family transcriptional regulator [Steroidobacteraceae bacterium]
MIEVDTRPQVMPPDDVIRLLAEHGVKPTMQRVTIASVLLAQPTHMSAEQILANLRTAGERISKATVYNTLKALVDSGLVRQIHLDPNRSVYDSTRANHHHFHDVDSGTLWDIKPEDIEFSRFPQLPEGMETASVEVVIRVRRRA